jgi:ferredoxin/DNA-binding MarR family transcriptional regulator
MANVHNESCHLSRFQPDLRIFHEAFRKGGGIMPNNALQKPMEVVKLIGHLVKAMAYQFKVTPEHKKLREKLDEIANGFPNTKFGAELRVLAQLFTREEAGLCLAFEEDYETASEISARIGADTDDIEQKLEGMSRRGLIYRIRRNGKAKYRLAPFIVGILEFQINNLNPSLGINIGMMMQGGYQQTIYAKKTPHLRTIPIGAEIVRKDKIMPYDDVVAILKSRDRLSIGECLCRKIGEGMGNPCNHPLDTCFQFNEWADYYVENGLAQYISTEDALEKLKRNEKEGLVNQVANSKEPELMCSCCSCHCELLTVMKKYPGPACESMANYICKWDTTACTNCGICAKRCPAGAHTFTEGRSAYSEEKCVGCGLCVTTCKPNACALVSKPDDAQYEPLDTLFDTYKEMTRPS